MEAMHRERERERERERFCGATSDGDTLENVPLKIRRYIPFPTPHPHWVGIKNETY